MERRGEKERKMRNKRKGGGIYGWIMHMHMHGHLHIVREGNKERKRII